MTPVQGDSAGGPAVRVRRAPAPAQPQPEAASERGLQMIARFEGFRSQPYNDATGNATIGYGHLIHHGPVSAADYPHGISTTDALALLHSDVRVAENAVRNDVHVPLTQAQFDALVSFTFNCGTGALAASQALRDLNQHDYQTVPGELLHWSHGNNGEVIPGLLARRRAEGELFAHGTYPS